MCNILVDACAEPAYAEASLAAWGKREWQECIDDLEQTKAICLRADSRIQMSYHDVEDGEINAERAALVCFNKRFEIVTKACRVNLCIAKIRVDLETQLAAGALGPPAVDPVKVAAVLYVVCDDWIVVPVVRANLTPSRSNLVYCHRNKVKESDSDVVKKHVFNLFQPTGGDPIKDSGDDEQNLPAPQPILKNLEDLKEILSVKPYNLKWWQGRLETLLSEWNEQCFGKNLPSLIVLGYNRPLKPKSKSRMSRQTTPRSRASPARSIELDGLQRGRIALRDDHGEDPLETSRELAEQATGIPRAARSNHGHWTEGNETPTTRRRRSVTNNEENADAEERTSKRPDRSEGRSLYEDKKSKSKLMFDDSTDEEDDQRNDSETELRKKRARLSHVPERRKSSGSGVKKDPDSTYTGPPPDEGIFDTSGNVIHRHQWTEQEMCALVLGLEKFGVGKWVQIKNAYGEILRNRSSVQVKDKYRNMKKNGDLPEEFL